MSTLRVRGLAKSFGATPVLHDLDLTVPDGHFAAVLGPSGCGKSTLLRLVAGFERADRGEIEVGGTTVARPGTHVRPERRRVGIVPQEGALFPHLSVADNVSFGLGRRERRHGGRVAEVLDLVGLAEYGDRMPHELSGGQQQRVALARALAPRPALVLLDEPFNALDPSLRLALRGEVREMLREAGTTALLVTHDQEEALSTADLVALLREGRVVQADAPRAVYDRPCDVSAAGFLGETVLVPGEIRDGVVECALGPLMPHAGTAAEGRTRGTVALRPEQLVLDTRAPVSAEVKDSRFLGHDTVTLLSLTDSGTEISARLHAYPPPEAGTVVGVRVAGEVSFFPEN